MAKQDQRKRKQEMLDLAGKVFKRVFGNSRDPNWRIMSSAEPGALQPGLVDPNVVGMILREEGGSEHFVEDTIHALDKMLPKK